MINNKMSCNYRDNGLKGHVCTFLVTRIVNASGGLYDLAQVRKRIMNNS